MNAEDRYISDHELSCACCGGSGHRDDVWKPLETMPKDGRMFLVCLPRMMGLVVRCWYNKTHGYFSTDMDTDGGITRPIFFHKNEQYGDDVWTNIPDRPVKPS